MLWPVSSVHKSQALKNGKEFTFFPRALHRKDVSKNNADRIRKIRQQNLLFTQAAAIKTEDCVDSVPLVPLPEKCMFKRSFTLPMSAFEKKASCRQFLLYSYVSVSYSPTLGEQNLFI